MTTGITTQHPFSELPYLTVTEYTNAPTALDINNLVVGGNASAQSAELANVILRATSYLDAYLNQNLNASTQTENQRVRFTPQGFIALHPNNSPVISLQSFAYSNDPNNLQVLTDPSQVWFEDQQIIIPISQLGGQWTNQGPLGFGWSTSPRNQIFCRYTYTSGYVNTTVAVASTAGQSSLTVTDSSGIVAGMRLRIYDGANSESITVASTYTYGSTTVPTTSVMLYNHAVGASLGNLPNAIKEACILVVNALIKSRGSASMTMNMTVNPSRDNNVQSEFSNDIKMALSMVNLYRRVR